MVRKRRRPRRIRVGRVSCYWHHGSWHVYYREHGRPIRRRVGQHEQDAVRIATDVNAHLTSALPSMFSFTAVSLADLRQRFLDHHEFVARSSMATVARYRAATHHLLTYSQQFSRAARAHELDAEAFAMYLRKLRVSPNGHPNSATRALRGKGIRFILETCRAMYGYAAKRRHLPPYSENPFAGVGNKQRWIEDRKPIFVFDEQTEVLFFKHADSWAWPLHFLLAKTGLRPGEAVHLLIEDLDLDGGWLKVRNKPELGWCSKTRRERAVPLVDELAVVLRHLVAGRPGGPVFLRPLYRARESSLAGADLRQLVQEAQWRFRATECTAPDLLSDAQRARIFRSVWRDAGAVRLDFVRNTFMRIARFCGLNQITCPKSWRHTFATLLQDANVDPLVRQITLGHAPTFGAAGALGMTTIYTHTRPETQRQEILRALRLWPKSLELAILWCKEARND